MEKLFELRIGAGTVVSGMWPLDASDLVRDLLAALAEEGADEALLQTSNAHIQIVKKDSTLAAVHTNHVRKLRPPLTRFKRKARSLRLGPKGLAFTDRATASSNPWGYVDLIDKLRKKDHLGDILRFDAAFRARLLAKNQEETIRGTDEIYAKVIRAGGERPTAKLEFLNGESDTFQIKNQELARVLGAHLYDVVKLKADVVWDRRTLKIVTLTVTGIVDSWRDVNISTVMQENGGVLPIAFDCDSVEQLIAGRHANDRGA